MSTDPTEIRIELVLPDDAATVALGLWLGAHLTRGEALALEGELGAGKTTLARGVALGLGVDDPAAVASPTYLLVVEHAGPVPMIHVDAYFPDKTRSFLADGGAGWLDEMGGVAVVEWADRIVAFLPRRRVTVRLGPRSDGLWGRDAVITAPAEMAWVAAGPGIGPD